MLVIEYDHRSLKALPENDQQLQVMYKFVDMIKTTISPSYRRYNPENRTWFFTQNDAIERLKFYSGYKKLDVNWEKRI